MHQGTSAGVMGPVWTLHRTRPRDDRGVCTTAGSPRPIRGQVAGQRPIRGLRTAPSQLGGPGAVTRVNILQQIKMIMDREIGVLSRKKLENVKIFKFLVDPLLPSHF